MKEETSYITDDLFVVDEAYTSLGIDNSITYIVIANNCIKTDEKCINGTELVNGTDYTLTYANNINVGYGKVLISGKGNFRGVIEAEFEITGAQMDFEITGYTGIFDNQYHSIKINGLMV